MVHHRNAGVSSSKRIGEFGSAVGGGIIDDEDVVAGDLAFGDERVAGLERRLHGALDGVLLVPHRVEDRQALEVRHVSHAR
jgi:hypothetical protein